MDVTSVAITSDNNFIVSGSYDITLRIWNFQDKCQVGVFEGHTDGILCVAIASDNAFIVSSSYEGTVRVWDFQKKSQELVLNE